MYKTCQSRGQAHAYAHMKHGAHQWRRRPKYNVPVNIEEKEEHYEVSVFATGFDKANIKLTVAEDNLFIKGTRTLEAETNPVFIKQEFPVRSFERVLFLNGRVDAANIIARQENSILVITLPKVAGPSGQNQEIRIE